MTAHKLNNSTHAAPVVATLRCPHCGHVGAFPGPANCSDVSWQESSRMADGRLNSVPFAAGVRICPNPTCRSLVHVVLRQGELCESFPPEVIDFDSTNLPPPILSSLEEAIKAHAAGCFKACALMVRRVLEDLCDDKNATGGDLRARLAVLGQNVLVPKDLLDAADELRLLGNDAAHIKAKNYDAIGKDESCARHRVSEGIAESRVSVHELGKQIEGAKKTLKP